MTSEPSTLERDELPVGAVPGLGVALPLVGLLGAELFVLSGNNGYALWGYALSLVAATLVPLRTETDAGPFVALALVPAFRLVTLGMPVFSAEPLYWLAATYAVFLPVFAVLSHASALDVHVALERGAGDANAAVRRGAVTVSMRWRRALGWAAPAVVLGLALAHLQYGVIESDPLVAGGSTTELLLAVAVLVGLAAPVEELLFRGVLQRVFQRRLGRVPGLLLASGVFGLVHAGYGAPEGMLAAGVVGLVLGAVYDWSDSLALVALLHGASSVFLFAVIPLYDVTITIPVV
jgi:membrane protease YdiL (CAAX protease family)